MTSPDAVDDILDAYATLGLDPALATPGLIRKTYRLLILRNHPDTVQEEALKAAANETTVRLNRAYETLQDNDFPRLSEGAGSTRGSAARAEREPPSNAGEYWQPQPDPGDEEFEKWRTAFLRDFRTVFAHDVRQVGVVRTVAIWGYHGYLAAFGILLGVVGLSLVWSQSLSGILLAILGFGGAALALLRLNGHRD